MGVIELLERELERRNIRFRPHFWLSREWFSPGGVPGVAIPFYLAHPRLMRLERAHMFEVEGGSREECLKILRHEMRARAPARLSAPSAPLVAEVLRPFLEAVSEVLPAESGLAPVRAAPPDVLRAEPSGRGFRGDVRRLAPAARDVAAALRGVAGARQAGVRRRADGRDRPESRSRPEPQAGRAAARAEHDASRALRREARAVRAVVIPTSTTGISASSSRTTAATTEPSWRRRSSGETARRSAISSRAGRGSTSSRSNRCSTT